MKKLISLVMAITMIFSVFTVNVGAAEIDTTNREQLLSLACQVFPEYAAKIAADQAPTSDGIKSVSENIEIIFTETRKANDDFYITFKRQLIDSGIDIPNGAYRLTRAHFLSLEKCQSLSQKIDWFMAIHTAVYADLNEFYSRKKHEKKVEINMF